ncbi:MAG: virginiamycin B lyase family protein [Acidimicrobiales bacterium]
MALGALASLVAAVVAGIGSAAAAPPSLSEFKVPTPSATPSGITVGPDSNLWFTEVSGNKIGRMSPAGAFVEYPIPTPNSFPFGITSGPDGNLWFTENAQAAIARITTAGVVTEYRIPTASAQPFGITSGPDGNLWFTEQTGPGVGRITTAGTITEFTLPTANASALGIVGGPGGALWLTEEVGKIAKVTTAGSVTEYSIPVGGSDPKGVTVGPDGNLWFAEPGTNSIGQFVPGTTTFSAYPVPTPGAAPFWITTGPDNNLWFTEENGNNLGTATVGGALTDYPVPTAASRPGGIVGGPGALWFTEENGNNLGRAVPAGSGPTPSSTSTTQPVDTGTGGGVPPPPVSTTSTSTTSTTTPNVTNDQICPASEVVGWFEPTQGVWQDDPLGATDHFADAPGRQLRRISATSYAAELPMVRGRHTLLFGIDHAVGGVSPQNYHDIVITGRTTGSVMVPVKMRFSTVGALSDLDYTTDVLGNAPLGGPCGASPRTFTIDFSVPNGAPLGYDFTWSSAGQYTILDELLANGLTTGINVSVSGQVVNTGPLVTHFIPVVLSATGADAKSSLTATSEALANESSEAIPDYFPMKYTDFLPRKDPLTDLSAQVDGAGWLAWAASKLSPESPTTVGNGKQDAFDAALTQKLSVGSITGGAQRIVALVSTPDFTKLYDPALAQAFASSQKVILARDPGTDQFTVGHELTHTLPYAYLGFSTNDGDCAKTYHNKSELFLAHGFQIRHGAGSRREEHVADSSYMSGFSRQWTDQCTYRHLIDQMQNPPDPPVVLVQGRLARSADHARLAGQLLPSYQLDSQTDLAPGDGPYTIVQRDAGGAVLGRYPFTPSWERPTHPSSSADLISFAERIPDVAGVASVELNGPSGLLDRQTISPTPPTVSITSPSPSPSPAPGVEAAVSSAGTVHVSWQASSAPGNPVVATVLYSHDGGQSFAPQVIETGATDADVTVRPSPVQLVRVVVSDGTRSASADVRFSTGDANGRFLQQAYYDLLHRWPDAAGGAAWSPFSGDPAGRARIVAGLTGGEEHRRRVVGQLYRRLLERAPDPSGLAHQADRMAAGATPEDVAAELVGSGEYQALHGGNEAGFLDAAYRDLLDRAPDPTGSAWAHGQLAGGTSRAEVAAVLVSSAEHAVLVVDERYLALLDRAVDPLARAYWSGRLIAGLTDDGLAAALVSSTEYLSRPG